MPTMTQKIASDPNRQGLKKKKKKNPLDSFVRDPTHRLHGTPVWLQPRQRKISAKSKARPLTNPSKTAAAADATHRQHQSGSIKNAGDGRTGFGKAQQKLLHIVARDLRAMFAGWAFFRLQARARPRCAGNASWVSRWLRTSRTMVKTRAIVAPISKASGGSKLKAIMRSTAASVKKLASRTSVKQA